jgi:hypothetical protein
MALFKFIDIPNYDSLQLKIKDYLYNKTDVITNPGSGMNPEAFVNFLDPIHLLENVLELNEWFTGHKLEALYVNVFGISPKAKNLLHVDGDLDNGNRDVRILLPIQNTEGSFTRFYDVPKELIQERISSYGAKHKVIVGDGPFPLLGELSLTKPILFDSGIPHDVIVNKESGYRVSMAIGFKKAPYHWLDD